MGLQLTFPDRSGHVDALTPSWPSIVLRNIASLLSSMFFAFFDAKEAISRQAGRSPSFLICESSSPNAFATNGQNGDIVGVTVGMMKLVNGDRDMAAAVIGHELGHHIKDHMSAGQSREEVLGLFGLIVGIALDNKIQSRGGLPGLGGDIGRIGSTLISRKFDRDQEREADEIGFNYLVAAGFNPMGAVRMSERMQQLGGGVGLFFDSHPGWSERGERFRTLITSSPAAQQILARTGGSTQLSGIGVGSGQIAAEVTLAPIYETTNAEKSFNDGIEAWKRNDYQTGLREVRSAAEAGYAPAQSAAGWVFLTGSGGVAKNEQEAARLFKLAAAQNHPIGINNLGVMHARGIGGIEKNEAAAVQYYRQAAELGFPQAYKNLGDAYGSGRLGLPRDPSEALKNYLQARARGHADATAMVATYYAAGQGGVSKDEVEAVRIAREAISNGSMLGEYLLGMAYLNGIGGLPKDATEALNHIRTAANKGVGAAQNALGNMYLNGSNGLNKDETEAIRLYRLAASQGVAVAQSNLGQAYMNGRGGLPRDDTEAVRLFRLSADQGSSFGQFNLGLMYELGRGGLPKDLDAAGSLYQKAAAQGMAIATTKLRALGKE